MSSPADRATPDLRPADAAAPLPPGSAASAPDGELSSAGTGQPPRGTPVLAADRVRKSFRIGERELEILHGVTMELHKGEVLAITGPSGAGKSTLLHTLGLLERPSEGRVLIEGRSAWELSLNERAALRNRRIGFVFQFYHLLPELTALENVLLPGMISDSVLLYRRHRKKAHATAEELLVNFGLQDRLTHRPPQLSGGERQRVALARALFHDPPILIADEPTGNLDTATGERVLELLFAEQERRSLSLILVTHDERLAARCQRALYMEDGQIGMDSGSPIPT